MRKQEKNSSPDQKNQRQHEVQDQENNITKKDPGQKQKQATMGEIPYSRTIGRHGTDEEKDLNPEE